MTRQKGGILPEKATPSFFSCQSARDLPRSTASLARKEGGVKRGRVCSEREGEAPAEPNISANREMGRSAERQLGRSEE